MSDLAALLDLHRNLYRDETKIRPTSRAVPSETEPIFIEGAMVPVVDAGPLGGMPFNPAFVRRIGHPEQFGALFPFAKALWLLRVECRRSHPQHRSAERPYWRGALCHEVVRLTVVGTSLGPLTPEQAAGVLRLDEIDPLLRRCLRFLEETMDDFRRKAEKRAKEDEGRAIECQCGHAWSRHGGVAEGWRCLYESCGCRRYSAFQIHNGHEPLDGAHREECPQCRRAA